MRGSYKPSLYNSLIDVSINTGEKSLNDYINNQNCLFGDSCKRREIVYQAKVTFNGKDFFYIKFSANYILKKVSYLYHLFRNKGMTLPLTPDINKVYSIKRGLLGTAPAYKIGKRFCSLCSEELFFYSIFQKNIAKQNI